MKRRHDYSQHFLRSPTLVKILLGHSTIKRRDTIVDIGAGSGVITSTLAPRVQQVIAIESEPLTASKLRTNLARFENVSILEQDILDYEPPLGDYVIFANIPFHLSSPIVQKFVFHEHPPRAIYLIVQVQFAQKLRSDSRHFTSQLGMSIAPLYSVRIRKRLQRSDFMPRPNVDTVFVELLRRDEPLVNISQLPKYLSFTKRCFEDPKYYLSTNRAAARLEEIVQPSRSTAKEWLKLFASTQL